jgi:hypothetical protein
MWPTILFLINLLVSTAMCGIIWFTQLSHYPLLGFVGKEAFMRYEQEHVRRISFVAWFMLAIELVTSAVLVIARPAELSFLNACIGLLLMLVIWVSTWILQFPYHKRLQAGFDATAHAMLVSTNWIRTIAWTLRVLLLATTLAKMVA